MQTNRRKWNSMVFVFASAFAILTTIPSEAQMNVNGPDHWDYWFEPGPTCQSGNADGLKNMCREWCEQGLYLTNIFECQEHNGTYLMGNCYCRDPMGP